MDTDQDVEVQAAKTSKPAGLLITAGLFLICGLLIRSVGDGMLAGSGGTSGYGVLLVGSVVVAVGTIALVVGLVWKLTDYFSG